MRIVAGLSLKNLKPRVWDPASSFHLPELSAVMVSYAEFHQMKARRAAAMEMGLRAYLGVPEGVAIYLESSQVVEFPRIPVQTPSEESARKMVSGSNGTRIRP